MQRPEPLPAAALSRRNFIKVSALVGGGDAYTRLGRRGEAADLLTRAETAAPDNPAVLAAQGRLHAASGRTTLAIAYYERALVIDANTAGARAELAALQRLRQQWHGRPGPRWVFGYASLVSPASAAETLDRPVEIAALARLHGHARGWTVGRDNTATGPSPRHCGLRVDSTNNRGTDTPSAAARRRNKSRSSCVNFTCTGGAVRPPGAFA